MDDKFTELHIDLLTEPWVLLRPVDTQALEYLEMRDSLEARGFLNSIAVRPSTRKPGKFEIIDGMYRWTCCKEIGRQMVPAIIKYSISDEEVLALQIQANAIRPETTPLEFARQLQLLQKARPGITLAGLSTFVKKSPAWIRQILGLLNLNPKMQAAVDRGEIPLENAYRLSMIPPRYREDFLTGQRRCQSPSSNHLLLRSSKPSRKPFDKGSWTSSLRKTLTLWLTYGP